MGILVLPLLMSGQPTIEWNAWMDVSLSQGQDSSHYFYNEIHKTYKDWRLSISDLNLLTTIKLDSSWSINARGRLMRYGGKKLETWQLPLLNMQYQPSGSRWRVVLGRMVSPYGTFSNLQHPTQLTFVNLPLAYYYFTNVSPQSGFAYELGENTVRIDGNSDWGVPMIYYGRYVNGVAFNWAVIPGKLDWETAITNGALNLWPNEPWDFENWGVVTKATLQPTYYWEQAFSVSYGTFQQPSSSVNIRDRTFNQWLFGAHSKLGIGFWETNIRIDVSRFDVPEINRKPLFFSEETQGLTMGSIAGTLKYEVPQLSGLYVAYGLDYLWFGDYESLYQPRTGSWDNNVLRHNFGLGYKINRFLLLRMNYQVQSVDNHAAWEQNTFRSVLTIHY